MEIKFGDIKYFTLLSLQDQLRRFDFNRLPLNTFDKLKLEVDMAVEKIHYQEKHKNDCTDCDGTGIIDNSYMTCLSCKGTGKRNKS